MRGPGDRLTTVIAREFVATASASPPLSIVAATTVSSLVAAMAARRLGADGLAIATGFGTLDAAPRPTLSLLESALGADASPQGPPSDTFVAVAKGLVGVAVVPAQLDSRGRTNLSGVGGSHERPAVALPGSRGLPDNNDSPSRVWYLLPAHSSRQLVGSVDFVSGVTPATDRYRRLLTGLGVFSFRADEGWSAVGLFADADRTVVDLEGFPIAGVADAATIAEPTTEEMDALDAVDPDGLRHVEFMGRDAAARSGEIIAAERREWGAS